MQHTEKLLADKVIEPCSQYQVARTWCAVQRQVLNVSDTPKRLDKKDPFIFRYTQLKLGPAGHITNRLAGS
jgi:hypothetical protein